MAGWSRSQAGVWLCSRAEDQEQRRPHAGWGGHYDDTHSWQSAAHGWASPACVSGCVPPSPPRNFWEPQLLCLHKTVTFTSGGLAAREQPDLPCHARSMHAASFALRMSVTWISAQDFLPLLQAQTMSVFGVLPVGTC